MIYTKKQSDSYINRLGLNTLDSLIVSGADSEKISSYIEKTGFEVYNIRDMKTSGKLMYGVAKEKVVEEATSYEKCRVYESLIKADEKLIMQGDFIITKDYELTYSVSSEKCIPLRVAAYRPMYTGTVDLKERNEPKINGLREIVDYLIEHRIFDKYVEASIFDCCVGKLQQSIIVWEVRNY